MAKHHVKRCINYNVISYIFDKEVQGPRGVTVLKGTIHKCLNLINTWKIKLDNG